MAATLMITSKGVAGVPRASLVVILATLKQFGLPEAGLFLILVVVGFAVVFVVFVVVVGDAVLEEPAQLSPAGEF